MEHYKQSHNVTERLAKVARRRSDDANVIQMTRETCNRLVTSITRESPDTRIAEDTRTDVCPLFHSLQSKLRPANELHEKLGAEISDVIASSAGYRPKTLDEGTEIATKINELAKQYGLQLTQADEPNIPVSLAFRKVGGANPGAFVLRFGSKTRYSGVEVPSLSAEPKP
jgi:vacuolar-type H+-ATPase subunit I/STV1